jgi:hypothetical protein
MDVFCVGMYRACSTWPYNVAAHLVEQYRGGRRLGDLDGERFARQPHGTEAPTRWRVLKYREAPSAFTAALAEGQARAVYCYRKARRTWVSQHPDTAFSTDAPGY